MLRRTRRLFNLPMTLTNLMTQRAGRFIAHSLDFDIVSVASDEETAMAKLRIAVKTYVEFGISKGWQDFIVFPAPQEYWDELTPETPLQLGPDIIIDGVERKVVEAKLLEDCVAA